MPKQVDHDERRREIGHAVARIAAAEGLEAVTMRRVAAEAGMSTPSVQHYFADKNAMLRHAVTDLTGIAQRTAEERVRAVVDPDAPDHPVPMLRAVLDEFLPLDDDRRTVLLLHLAFFARAASDPDLASFYRDASPGLTVFLADVLREERDAGRAAPGIDPEQEADTLVTLGVGLGTDMLMGTRTAAASTGLIDYHLARLLPGVRPGGPR